MNELISQLAVPQLGLNLVDFIVIGVVLIYAFEGYLLGFIHATLDLLSLILSFIIGLKTYSLVSIALTKWLSVPDGFAKAGGFFLVAILSELLFSFIFRLIYQRYFMPAVTSKHYAAYMKANRWLGVLPGIGSAFVILSFLLSTILALPSSPFIKNLITTSKGGSLLVAKTTIFEKSLNAVFGPAFHDTLNFLTIEPESDEVVNLKFTVAHGTIDQTAEEQMLAMVNQERTSRGILPLTMDEKLRTLARSYSNDMLQRGYFSHYNPEGEDPFDRMKKQGIIYTYAGENLALAPSTELAMQGLMNSKGHRENILSPHYRKIGIGVIDGGIYGKMYTQEFTD